MQPSTESSVVLPLPDGPISRVTSPPRSDSETSFKACTAPAPLPSILLMSCALITGSFIA
jgi:hypothetical protein